MTPETPLFKLLIKRFDGLHSWTEDSRAPPNMKPRYLNVNALKPDAIDALRIADHTLVGTTAYMGIAWFWHNDYKHNLRGDVRPISYATRRKVHNAWLRAGLAVDGSSPEHKAILHRYVPVR